MNYWQFKVGMSSWANGLDYKEYARLRVGGKYIQEIADNTIHKPTNNIGDIVFIYNTKKNARKSYPQGIYLICKIIKNYNFNNNKTVKLEVIQDLRYRPIEPAKFGFKNTMQKIHNLNQNGRYYRFEEEDNPEHIYKLIHDETILIEDFKSIFSNDTNFNTEAESTILTRMGQGKFRDSLIEYWEGCSVTKFKFMELLIASHIKPWRDSSDKERLDVYNGLLLLPNIDKLFDKGYVSFNDSGKILISDTLKDLDKLGINLKMKIKIEEKHKQYLKFHRKNIFKK